MTQFDKLYTSREKLVKTVLDLEEQISQGGGGGSYPPSGGVPKTDLASSVQASLDKADSAYQKPETGIPSNDLASGVIPDVSGKEDKMAIVAASGTSLAPAVNTYYRFDAEVGILAITLPAITDTTHISNIVFMLTTGSSPAVTFAASGTGINVIAQDGFNIEASTTYEINAIYNGVAWVVAAMKLSSTPINS